MHLQAFSRPPASAEAGGQRLSHVGIYLHRKNATRAAMFRQKVRPIRMQRAARHVLVYPTRIRPPRLPISDSILSTAPCLQKLLMLLNPLVARGNRGCGQLKVICGYCQSPRARGNPLLRPPMYGQTKCNFSTHCPTEMNICLDAPEGWIPNMIHELTHVRQCCDKSWINMECDNIIRLEREAFLVARQCDPASRLPNSLTNCCVRACQSAGDACPSQAVCRAKCLAMFP